MSRGKRTDRPMRRTIKVDGISVRVKVTYSNGAYFAAGKDAKGCERADMGASIVAACRNLRKQLIVLNRYYKRHG
jgi:hypothetical protein